MTTYFGLSTVRVLAFALTAAFGAGSALADKPGAGEKGGKGNSDKGEQRDSPRGADMDRGSKGPAMDRGSKGPDVDRGSKGQSADRGSKGPGADVTRIQHFGEPHRTYVHDYYDSQFRAGKACPPGLAKKNNGCMPPGQAKKWDVGYVLPSTVRYYDVPGPLLIQFGQPPVGYRYVRVDDDILLLATGTRMIVDAIRNLGRS